MRGALTLGPLLFNWPAPERRDFYFRIADEAPVDAVCLGEVVCGKRTPFFAADLPAIAERLRRAGKQVVWSTMVLVVGGRDEESVRAVRAAANGLTNGQRGDLVEANDFGAIALLAGMPHAVGPFVNVYNEGTLHHLATGGAQRVALPFELPAESIRALAAGAGAVELEVQVFGRTPLAISARCYHARAHGRGKNTCDFVCDVDPDGLAVETLDGRPFLAINGTQTLSHAIGCLVHEIPALKRMGIGRFRLSPQRIDMVAVSRIFRTVLDGRIEGAEAALQLAELAPFAPFANGFFHGREGAAWVNAKT